MAVGSKQKRGSQDKIQQLFSKKSPTTDDVKAAIGNARVNFDVLRWWWKGTPRPDILHAVVTVPREEAGALVQEFLNNPSFEANVEVNGVGARSKNLVVNLTGEVPTRG
ncbi:MAG TPA: hypothetical protein VE262_10940 [Blastocatellia bacterium]|nr:hypothetical protein [Blastocatellia bacterium]